MSRAAAAALLTLLFLLVPVALFGQAAPLCDVTCSPNPGSGDYGSILAARPRLPNARGSMNPRVPMAARGPIPEPPIPTRPTDEAPSLPGSESYNYAIPLLHRPGRAGLDLDLTLYYNSRIWTVDSVNATATFNADNDWPSYGFRLGWGPLEYDASNDQYVVTLPDGSKETLTNNGAGAYVTTDGTLMSFGPAAQNGGNILRLKDGTWLQYIVFPTDSNLLRVQGITDPNGNVIFITYRSDAWAQTAGHGQEIDTIYDTAGNQFVFNYDANHRLSSISQGSKTWATFFWGTTTLTYSFSGLTVTADTQTSGSTINVLLSCTYADGTGYNFGYGGWGIVNTISRFNKDMTAVRSSVQYNYPAGTVTQTGAPTYTQQTVNDGVSTYSPWNYAATMSNGVVTSMTVTDPTGGKTVTNLDPNTGLTSSVLWQNSGGSTLRRQDYAWTANNQVQSITTTLSDTGQQAKVQYGYSATGLLTDTWEYDYGLVLKRHTVLGYLTTTPYLNQHILDRVWQTLVKDGSDNTVARTDMGYDSTSLTLASGAANHFDSSYGTGFTTRGNLTYVARYANAAAGTGVVARSFTYDTTGNMLTAQLDCCNQKTWTYSGLTQYIFPDSVRRGPDAGPQLTTSATYDNANGLVLSSTDENSRTTSFVYNDPDNRPTTITRPDNVTTSFAYDDTSQLASTTVSNSANSLVQKTTVNGMGRTLESDALNGTSLVSVSKQGYDSLGRTASVCNPTSDGSCSLYTTYSYDALGRVAAVTPPSAGAYGYAYLGNRTQTTDPAGKTRRSYTDALGRLVEVDEVGWGDGRAGSGAVTIAGAEGDICNLPRGCPPGHLIYDTGTVSITVNNGSASTKTVAYGSTSTTNSVASALVNAINGDGTFPATATLAGATVNLTTRTVGSVANSYSYSVSSQTNDPGDFFAPSFTGSTAGSTFTGAMDGCSTGAPSFTCPIITTYTYNALDLLTNASAAAMGPVNGVMYPGQPRSYAYDGLGRLTASGTPESGTTNFYYLTSGGAACSADASAVCYKTDARGITSTYSYDGLNRVTGVSYSDTTPAVSYAYGTSSASNNNGRLVTVSTGSGSSAVGESYTYDPLGRIAQAAETVGGTQYNVGYAYNLDNTLQSVTYPSGRVVSQSYDAIGRMTTIASGGTNFLSGVSYNPAGQALGFNYGNGVAAAFTYNDHLQLDSLRYHTSTQELLDLKYDYVAGVPGNNGQIQVQHYCTTALPTCTDDPTRTENFTYDAWGRVSVGQTTNLTGANTWKLQWSYDRLGNRLSQTETAGTASVTQPQLSVDQNTNRINTSGYGYDAAGNMTSDSLSSYAYDAENRLTQVNPGTSPTATYTYLGALRVERQFGGTTVYVYSGTQPIAEYTAGAQLTQPNKEYIYSGSQLLATVDASLGTSYQYHDHLSTRVEADVNGSVTRTFGHFPYGETWYETGTASKWKFTSYERAATGESDLDYAQFRFNSARLGRFMSPDLLGGDVGNPQSLNRYSYVLNDPISYSDPLGLFCVWDDGSYDSADDPDTGAVTLCSDAGGTWFDGSPSDQGLSADWSPDANFFLAMQVSLTQASVSSTPLITVNVWPSSGLVGGCSAGVDGFCTTSLTNTGPAGSTTFGGGGVGTIGPTPILECTAAGAEDMSLASIGRVQDSFLGETFLGNMFSGAYNSWKVLKTTSSAPEAWMTLVVNGARLGLPGGGTASKGVAGVAQEAVLKAALQNLGREAAAAGTEWIGNIKIAYDGATAFQSFVNCIVHR